jgi:hypothetical protein
VVRVKRASLCFDPLLVMNECDCEMSTDWFQNCELLSKIPRVDYLILIFDTVQFSFLRSLEFFSLTIRFRLMWIRQELMCGR